MTDTGIDLHRWATDLFPICRSLTGDGVRSTLSYLKDLAPELEILEVPSGTQAFDWTVPDEWNVVDAYVADLDGNRVIDFRKNNLHLMGYSSPIDAEMTRGDLEPHLYSLPDQPTAIPYVTSYYSRNWGFCLTQVQRDALGEGPFRVVIDSQLAPGSLTYGELVIPGSTTDEILLSTYMCHPSMANNELSGPVVATALARWLTAMPDRRFTYRILFLPETIGAILYLSRHLSHLKANVKAGWVLTCIGDDRTYSYLSSRRGGTLADRVSLKVLEERGHDFVTYPYLARGSDERQWGWPGVDLPVASLMRSKYATFPEYHTSLDDLELVTADGLQGGLDLMKDAIKLVEKNQRWHAQTFGEPQMGKRGMYPTVSTKSTLNQVIDIKNVLTYCDGDHDVIEISAVTGLPTADVKRHLTRLHEADLIGLNPLKG